MAQLDLMLSVLASRRADGLLIIQDEQARLVQGENRHTLTKRPISAGQLMAIVREIAPGEAGQLLMKREPAQFDYTFGQDVFVTRARFEGDRLTVDVRPRTPYANTEGSAPPPQEPRPRTTGSMRAVSAATPTRTVERDDPAARERLVTLLRAQKERGASDLHLRSGQAPILRVDGDIVALDGSEAIPNDALQNMLRSIMGESNRREFEESSDTDLAYEVKDLGRFRVNVFRDRNGIGAVIRSISSRIPSAEDLGLTPEVQNLARLNKGLVLVTGPTGSGKSTTLCALLDLVNRQRREHIVTIEDPIEFVHENKGCLITQRQVGMHTSSFKQALRAALREDPDVVLVGELRDLETMSIAIETAETGHLVFGTLHTSTAPSTIDRVIDQFPSDRQSQVRVMLSESLKGVISQILCRRIGGGRVAAREILLSTPAIANLIREAKTFQIPSVMQTSRRMGMMTLSDALMELVDARLIEPKEALLRAMDKSSMAQSLKARGFVVE